MYKLGIFDEFQSTLPMKGATESLDDGDKSPSVSIHAPNEGSDEGVG